MENNTINTEDKSIKIGLNVILFTGICKKGFYLINTPNGRIEFQFIKSDIIDLYNGKIIEKSYYEDIYKFALYIDDKVEVVNIIKRSPIFSEIAETL